MGVAYASPDRREGKRFPRWASRFPPAGVKRCYTIWEPSHASYLFAALMIVGNLKIPLDFQLDKAFIGAEWNRVGHRVEVWIDFDRTRFIGVTDVVPVAQ